MTKQSLYDLSVAYRTKWTSLQSTTKSLLDSPITLFSLLVDNSAHGLSCPKADSVYKLYTLTRSDNRELAQLRELHKQVGTWIELLEGVE